MDAPGSFPRRAQHFSGLAVKLRDKKTLPSSGSVLDFNFRTYA
jgi:hypothetical protein